MCPSIELSSRPKIQTYMPAVYTEHPRRRRLIRLLAPFPALLLAFLLPVSGWTAASDGSLPSILEPTERHYQVAGMVTRFAERAHYSRSVIDDEMSAQLLENYVEALDANRHYFLQPDVDYFSRYQHALDDTLRSGDIEAVFDKFPYSLDITSSRIVQKLRQAIVLLVGTMRNL